MTKPEDMIILVVDDEPDVVTYLRTLLEDAGFQVVTACNGDEALEKVKKYKPNFISLDLVMPKKSGIKFYYELRRNKEWSRIPVVVVSGHANDEKIKRDMEDTFAGKTISGPQVYLEKPVKPQDYVNMVRRELGIQEQDAVDTVPVSVKQEVKQLLDDSSPEVLGQILEMLKEKKK